MAKKQSAEEIARNQYLTNEFYKSKLSSSEQSATRRYGIDSTVANLDLKDSKYDEEVPITEFTTQQQYDDGLANAQGKAAEWTNAVIGGVAKIVPTFIEYSANMLDAENLSGDTDYHNAVSDKMRELNKSIDEEIPIYKSSDAGMFSSEALAGTLQGTIASGAAFAALAGITGGVLATGLGTGAVASLVTTVAGAALATHAEGVGVAADVYTKGMEMQVNKGLADFRRQNPLATQQELDIEKERLSQDQNFITKAKEGANTAHSINMVNTLLNLTSVGRILNPAKFSTQLAKQFAMKELAKDYLKEGAQEALEENINLIAEKKGLALIANKAYGIKNAAETVFSEEGAEAALGGIFGAVIQTGATDIYKGATGVFKEQNERYNQAQQNINALKGFSDGIKKQVAEQDAIANITPKQMSFASFQTNAQETAFLHSALTLAEASKDEDLIGFYKNNLLAHHAVEAFKLGNAEAFEEVITQLEKSTPEAKKEITGSEDTESVRKQITDMRRVFKQTQELFDDNVTKVSSNVLGDVVKNKSEALEIERLEKQLHFDTKSANAKATLATIESLKAGGTQEDLDTFTKTISAEHAEEIKKFEEKQAKINDLKAINVTDALNLSNGITKKIVRQEEKAAQIKKNKVEQEKINKQTEKTNALLNNKAQKFANVIGNTPEETEAVSKKLDEERASAIANGDAAKAEELTAQKEQVIAKVTELVNKKKVVIPSTERQQGKTDASVSKESDNNMIAELNEAIREAQGNQDTVLVDKLKAQREKVLADLASKKPNGEVKEEIKTEEEVLVVPEFKLIHIPSKIAAPTVKSFNEVHSGEAYNKGSEVLGEGLSDEQKDIANNILDNGPDSIQAGTELIVSPVEYNGERSYQFSTKDGRIVGYLHKPEYIRPERLAESQHDNIESQKSELQGVWDRLNFHFDGPNPLPFLASTVTNKTAGFINQGSDNKLIAQDILTDENTVIVAVQAKGKVSIANQDIVEYLRVYLGGVISESDMKAIKKMPANTHLILVPTSVKVGDKVQYTYAYLNKTSLSENAEVSKIVTSLLTKYLNGEALSPDEKAFVVNVLSIDTELTTSKAGKPKVKMGGGEAVTIEQLNNLLKINEKVSIQIPFGFTHNSKISLNGSEVSIKELIGSSFKTNLLGYDLNTGEKGYTHNPILSFGPIDTAKLNLVISQPTVTEEVSKPSDEFVDDETVDPNDISDAEDLFLLSPIESLQSTSSIEKLMSAGSKEDKKKYNILKRQQIAKVLRNMIFNMVNKNTNKPVDEILKAIKQASINKTRFFDDAVAKGETENQEYADNFKFLTDNFNTFSKEAIKMLKEMGYVVNKTSSKLEEKPVDKDKVEGDIINNDVDASTDSELLNQKEGEHTQKIDVLAFSESPYAVSSSYVKMFLETISSGVKGILGGSELYGGKKLYGELLNAFADKNFTQEEFMQILNASAKPHFRDLATKFEALEQHFKNQILVSLSTTKGNFVGLNNDKVFNSNRNTKDVILRNTILNTLTAKLLTEGSDKQLNTLTSDGQILVDFLKSFADRDRKDNLSDMSARHILDSLGLSVTQAQLDMFKGTDETAFTVELVSNVLSTIEQALKLNNFKKVELSTSLNNILIGSELHGRHLENFIIESEGDSIIDVKGKKRFPFGIQHSTSKIWNSLTGAERITNAKRLVNVHFTSANTWLKSVVNGGVMPKLIYLDGSYGESFGDLDFKNKLKARFEFFKNAVQNKNNTYSFFSSAKSDKHLVIGADAPKILTNQKRHIFDIILAEAKRIKQYNEALKANKSKSIESIEGFDGSKFYLFPLLNDKSLTNVWVEGEINEALFSKEVDNAVMEQLSDLVFLPIANEIKANLPEVLSDEVEPFDFTKDKDIRDFAVSEIVNNYNFQSLVSGDPAFFAKGTVDKSLANLFKRLTRDIATAKRVVNVKATIKTICITEPSGKENNTSKNIEQLEAILGEQRTPKLNKDGSPKLDKDNNPEYDNFGYRNIDLADAQGYCTVKEYVTLLLGNGEISQAQYDSVINEWDNHFRNGGTIDTMSFSKDAISFSFKPRKPVTIGNHLEQPNGFDTEVSRPIYIKYSIFPLIPELLDKNSHLMNLAGLMQKHGIDRAVTKTGFKVGSPKNINIENITDDLIIDDINSIEVDRDMDGNQLDIPYDETKDEVLQGTQPMKLIFDSLEEKELKNKFEGLQKELLDEQYTEYVALLGLKVDADGTLSVSDFSKFKSYLEKSLSDTLENPNEEEVFDLNFDQTGFKHPLFFNKFGPKIETVLIQGFKKHVLKTKLGGKSYVLTSEYGFKGTSKLIKKTPSYNEEKGLLPQRLINSKGEIATAKEVSDYFKNPTEENKLTVAPAQVMVAWNFLDNKGEPILMEDFLDEKGELDMSKLPKEILEGFAYRIPTQGHNSMSSVEIVGFLPSYMGDTIIASKDWVTQMGSDFDIDKVFMHRRLTNYSNGKSSAINEKGNVSSIKNSIVDTYMEVLQKPEVFKQMIQPLGFGKLPDVVEKLKQHPDFQEVTTSILSPVTQNTNYENGTAGKLGIGLSSLISVFNSIVQGKGLKTSMMFPIVINGVQKWAGDLSGSTQLFNSKVSKNLTVSAFQSASTDNIKELLVKTIGYTDKTNPLLMSMGLLGLDEEFIAYMMAFKHNVTPRKQISENLAAYPLSLEMLQDSVLRIRDSKVPFNANEILQDEIITYYYNAFLKLGEELDNVSKIINTTTNGFGAYIEDVNILKETALEISKSTLLDKEGIKTILSDKLWGSGYNYLKQVNSLVNSLYPTGTPVYSKVMSKALSLVKYPTKEYRKAIKNFMKSYFFSSSSIFNGDVEKTRQRLLMGDKSLAHRLFSLKKEYPNNSFLNSLTFTFGGKNRPSLVTYVGKTLTPSEKYLWQEELKELYNSSDSEAAKDFIVYQYAVGGVQVPNSAISMLPYDLVEKMGISEDMYAVSMVEDPNNKMSVVDSIVMQFLQNNVKLLSKFNEELNNFVTEDAYKFSYAPLDVEELSQLKPLNSETLITENLELHNTKSLIKVGGDVYIYSHSNTTLSTYRKINPVGMFGVTETDSTKLTVTSAIKLSKQPNLYSSIFKKDTERLGDVLMSYFGTNRNKNYETLIRSLNSAVKKFNPEFNMYIPITRVPNLTINGVEVEGSYNGKAIQINSALSNEDFERTLIHETLHHLLKNIIHAENLPDSIKKSIVKLERLMEVAKTEADKGGYTGRKNAFLNLDEFINEMLTSKSTQEWANSIPFNKDTMWSKFKELVLNVYSSFMDIMGISQVEVEKDSLLEQILSETLFLQDTLKGKETLATNTTTITPTQSSTSVKPIVEIEANYYTSELLKANPDKIYVFGDNNQRQGKKGQASVRDEANAMGISTKLRPSADADAFMTDNQIKANVAIIDSDIAKIKATGKTIVFPKDGLGTGLAALKSKAPNTYEYLVIRLKEEFGFDNNTGTLVVSLTEAFSKSTQPSTSVESKRTFKNEEYHQAYIKGGLAAVQELIQKNKQKEMSAAKQLSEEVDMLTEFKDLNTKPNKTNSDNDRLIELYVLLKNSKELDFEYSLNQIGLSTQPSTQLTNTETVDKSINNTVTYTPKGKEVQIYTIKGIQIFNKNNEEVFKEDSVDRNKIFANLAIKEGRAVIVKYKEANYVVNNKEIIISGTTGNVMKWGAENSDRKAILAIAKDKLGTTKTEKVIPTIPTTFVTPQVQPTTSEEAIRAKYAPLIKQARLDDDTDGFDELVKAKDGEINTLLNPKSNKPPILATDETKELPNLPKYELFPNVYANKGQREAIDKIENFLLPSNKDKAFMLNGKGGTGKTTIIKKAIANKSGIMALAPSHKAKKVLGKSLKGVTGNVKTLASALAIKLNESTGYFEPDEFARKKSIPIQNASIIIIDESSMVSDDMFDEIMKLKQPFAKVIFMGDKAQLPPVGQEKDSKVFDIENSYELIEKMRQAKTSPIINIGSMIAANVETTEENRVLNIIKPEDRINKYDTVSGSSLQWIDNTDKAIDSFVKHFKEGNGDPDYVKMVTFNNELHNAEQSVKNLNIKVRDKLFGPNKKQYEVEELLTAYDTFIADEIGNQPIAAFHNSDDLIVLGSKEVKNYTGSVNANSFAKGSRTFNFEYDITYLNLELDGEKVPFQIPVVSESSLVKYKQDLSNLFKTDTQLAYALSKKFANLQYGYAITSHKSQGSTYKNVYVMEDNILGSTNGGSIKSKMQSLYVAVSRPTTNLYMVSYKNTNIQASPKEDNAISDEEILNSEKFITFMEEQKEGQYSGTSEQEMLDYFRNCKM